MYGIEYPIALLLFVFVCIALRRALKRKKRGALFHPWTGHLRARIGSGSVYSRFPLFVQTLAPVCMVLVIAAVWVGHELITETKSSRMVGLVKDVSGSMQHARGGALLEGARTIAQKLIEKRPDDRIGVTFFSSESNYTAFGIPAAYLSKKEVARRSFGLGGSTVVTHGLFTAFIAMAREDDVLTEEEIGELFRRVQSYSGPNMNEVIASRRVQFGTYLDALFSTKQFVKADRLLVLISDCDLQYEGYDVPSLMKLFKAFDIRLELVCIGRIDLEKQATYSTTSKDHYFVEGVKETGGGIQRIGFDVFDTPETLERALQETVAKIDAAKPRETIYATFLKKKFFARELFLAALLFLMIAEGLAVLRRFRMNA